LFKRLICYQVLFQFEAKLRHEKCPNHAYRTEYHLLSNLILILLTFVQYFSLKLPRPYTSIVNYSISLINLLIIGNN